MHIAASAGLDMVGLADHDTVDGWQEAAAAVDTTGVALLRATEISCKAFHRDRGTGRTVHMLSYLHRPDDPGLNDLFRRTKNARLTRTRMMVDKLSADFDITFDDVLAQAKDGVAIGRPHIADALVAAGYFPNRNACFANVLHPRSPYYVHYDAPDAVAVVATIRQAGGVPVYAHPRAAGRQKLVSTTVIRQMVEAGLFGMEAYHRDHYPREWVTAVETIARHFHIHVTGSSDYHGRGKPNRLGENLTPWETIKKIEDEGALPIIWPSGTD